LGSGIERDPKTVTDLLAMATKKAEDFQADMVAGLSDAFNGWRKAPKPASWDAFAAKVTKSGNSELVAKVRELNVLFGDGRALDDVKKLALDDKAELESRKAAVRSLIDARPDDLRAICEKLLSVRFLNTVAARGLALNDDPSVGVKLAKSYKTFHPSERAAVIETLVSRPSFAKALLDEIAAGRILREDVSAYHARQIRSFNDESLTKQLGQVWGEMRESAEDKRALISKLKTTLMPDVLAKADKSAGRLVFSQVCATCHTLYGEGGQVGPDLTGSGRGNIDYLLENIADPGAVVNADFRLNVLTLKDGRVLNGMVSAKTDRTLTLKTMTEPVTVERTEIAKQEELPQSMMPEGLLQAFTPQQVRDLIAYLMHPVQVPLPQSAGSGR
jgi:putative heme-binding domain-containing protein